MALSMIGNLNLLSNVSTFPLLDLLLSPSHLPSPGPSPSLGNIQLKSAEMIVTEMIESYSLNPEQAEVHPSTLDPTPSP